VPAIGRDGSIYVGSTDGFVYALDRTGVEKWKFDTKRGFSSDIAMDGQGTVYVASGGLIALSRDGRFKWKINSERADVSAPAIGPAGEVYFKSDGKLYAVAPNGQKLWEQEADGKYVTFSIVVGGDGTIYTNGQENWRISRIHAFRPDGKLKWTFETDLVLRGAPAVDDENTIYFSGFLGDFCAVDANGKLKWRFKTDGKSAWAGPAISENHDVYFGAGNLLYAVDQHGEEKWRFQTQGAVGSFPALDSEGNIWFTSNDGHLYVVGRDGSQKEALELRDLECGTPVISHDGTVYIRGRRALCAIRGPVRPSTLWWPMKRHDQEGSGRLNGK
jgi:outer membrane protein assembly factor BamB